MSRSGLAGLLGAIANDFDGEEEVAPLSHQEMLARLTAAAARYSAPCAFGVGEVVTPREDAMYGGAGQPMVVIAVRPDAPPVFDGASDTPYFGKPADMRVLRMRDNDVIPFWVESAEFERYVAPAVETAAQPDPQDQEGRAEEPGAA